MLPFSIWRFGKYCLCVLYSCSILRVKSVTTTMQWSRMDSVGQWDNNSIFVVSLWLLLNRFPDFCHCGFIEVGSKSIGCVIVICQWTWRLVDMPFPGSSWGPWFPLQGYAVRFIMFDTYGVQKSYLHRGCMVYTQKGGSSVEGLKSWNRVKIKNQTLLLADCINSFVPELRISKFCFCFVFCLFVCFVLFCCCCCLVFFVFFCLFCFCCCCFLFVCLFFVVLFET